ncbi:MAG TPA: OsmC family protein [Thermomicrobiales bacterium]|nr:OsmC family protein [Thermomicrobiales bacterium]
MARVTARSAPGRALTTIVEARQHRVVADEPAEAGGDDLGPGPYELLLAALGACTVMTVELYARRKAWPLEQVTIRLDHSRRAAGAGEEAPAGARIDRITYDIDLEGPLDATQRERLLQIAARCPVHRTLTGPLEIVPGHVPATAAPGE